MNEVTQPQTPQKSSAFVSRSFIQQIPYLRERNIFWISLAVCGAALLGSVFYLYLAFSSLAWQYFFLASMTTALFVVGIVSVVFVRRGRAQRGIWLLLVVGQVAIAISPLFTANQGVWYAAGIVMSTLIISTLTMPSDQATRANLVGILAGIGALAFDGYVTLFQLPPVSSLKYFIPAVVGFLTLAYIIVVVTFFSAFNLRIKVTLVVLSSTILSVVILSVVQNNISRNELTNAVNQTLLLTAKHTALDLDEYLGSVTDKVTSQATATALINYLGQSPAAREENASARIYLQIQSVIPGIEYYALLDHQGNVLIHTGIEDVSQIPPYLGLKSYFTTSIQISTLTGVTYLSPVIFPSTGDDPYFIVSAGIKSAENVHLGTLVVAFSLFHIQDLLVHNREITGENTFVVILDENHLRIGHGLVDEAFFRLVVPLEHEKTNELIAMERLPAARATLLTTYLPEFEAGLNNLDNTPFFSTHELGGGNTLYSTAATTMQNQPWIVAVMRPEEVILAPIAQGTRISIALAAIVIALTIIASGTLSKILSDPIVSLTSVAEQAAEGDLSVQAPVTTQDEIGTLGLVFNSMVIQLRQTLGSLEQRVAERTRDVEQRSAYLRAAADVGRAAASILNTKELIAQVVEVIRQRFNLYYVGLFLVDEKKEWAVLSAGTGEAGRILLERGHRIKIGEGMVGWSIVHKSSRIAAEVGEDQIRLSSDILPETRSEAALPLISRGNVLGALTVQSEHSSAFDESTLTVLQTMADQVALAMDNAKLFADSEESYHALQRSYGELSRAAWAEVLRVTDVPGYRVDSLGRIDSLATDSQPLLEGFDRNIGENQPTVIRLPVRVRDESIGMIEARKPKARGAWTPEEVALMNTLVDQLSVALENARLYEDTQRRAERERILADITSNLRSSTDINMILQTAVQELSEALRVPRSAIQLREE